jgi:peptidoglycan/xylan/chitin deacetylase (PgdA/CDA1 family)
MSSGIKRVIILIVSIAFFLITWLANLLRRLTGKKVRGTAVILYYHGIRPDQREQFARQLDTLMRWAKPIDVAYRSSLSDGERYAAITFDDGFESFLETALPELRKRNIAATLFVVAGKLGCYPEWDEYIEDPQFKEPLMTREQLARIPADLITIGSHTMTHPFLTRVQEADAKRELRESRKELESMLGRRIALFSFPHGDFNDKLVEWCRESGYEHVFTILPEPAFCESDHYVIGRVGVNLNDWKIEFLLKLFGAYSWLPSAFSLKRKMLLKPAVS